MSDNLDRLKDALSERYTIEHEIGAGGMATVYLAHDLKHDRKVAVKVLRPELVEQAWDYFRNVQTKDVTYRPLIRPDDRPAIELNADIMARYRPQMQEFYYDASRFDTYLEQLGVEYPTLRTADGRCGVGAIP